MQDTDIQTEEFYFSLIASLTPAQRLEKLINLSQAMRELTREHIALRYPKATPAERDRHFVRQVYGEEFVSWLK